MGLMKQGVSLMTMFFACVGISSWMYADVLMWAASIVWCYSFFHVHNLRSLSEEEFQKVEDKIHRTPIVKVIASPAYRIPTRREFHLINLSDKAVVDVYLLFSAAIRAFYSFMHHDFFNQGV